MYLYVFQKEERIIERIQWASLLFCVREERFSHKDYVVVINLHSSLDFGIYKEVSSVRGLKGTKHIHNQLHTHKDTIVYSIFRKLH